MRCSCRDGGWFWRQMTVEGGFGDLERFASFKKGYQHDSQLRRVRVSLRVC
jgi:hypothetical protein